MHLFSFMCWFRSKEAIPVLFSWWLRFCSLISKCLFVFFPPRSLAWGFTMLLREREGSHSCCFYTASLSSGRSEGNQGWGGGGGGSCGNSISSTALCSGVDCNIMLVQLLGVCYIGHLSKISPESEKSMTLMLSAFTDKSLQSGSWAAKTNARHLIHRHDLPSGENGLEHSRSLPPDMKWKNGVNTIFAPGLGPRRLSRAVNPSISLTYYLSCWQDRD